MPLLLLRAATDLSNQVTVSDLNRCIIQPYLPRNTAKELKGNIKVYLWNHFQETKKTLNKKKGKELLRADG